MVACAICVDLQPQLKFNLSFYEYCLNTEISHLNSQINLRFSLYNFKHLPRNQPFLNAKFVNPCMINHYATIIWVSSHYLQGSVQDLADYKLLGCD